MNLYDFDKTIYKGESSSRFYFFVLRKYPLMWWHFFVTTFWGLLAFFHIVGLTKFKEKVFSVLRFIPNVDGLVKAFWDKEQVKIYAWYKERKKPDDVICSATPKFLLQEIFLRINSSATLICSDIDKETGKFLPGKRNCKGPQKVAYLLKEGYKHFDEGYTDSNSDKPMLRLCDKPYRIRSGIIYDFDLDK